MFAKLANLGLQSCKLALTSPLFTFSYLINTAKESIGSIMKKGTKKSRWDVLCGKQDLAPAKKGDAQI